MSPSELGDTIRRLREKAGLTQEDLARRAAISQPYLSQLESGRVKHPAVQIVQRLAKVLGVKIEDVLE